MKAPLSLGLFNSSLRRAQVAFSYSLHHSNPITRVDKIFLPHRRLRQASSATMATDTSVDGLTRQLQDLPVLDRYPNCYPDINPVDVYRAHITSILQDITGVDAKVIYPAIQWTSTLEKGDLMLAIPALRVKGKPDELGKEWLSKWPDSPLVEKPVQSGPFIPFFFKPGPLTKVVIPMALSRSSNFGENRAIGLKDPNDESKGRKRMIVEFSSPNIAKPFHAGHLRSTIIGGFLSNLYRSAGWDVTAINYLGDWGKQYGVLALGFAKYGNEDDLAKDPINHLFQVYVRISADLANEKDQADALKAKGNEAEAQKLLDEGLDEKARSYFKKMTDGDEEALALWKRFRDLSIERYKQTYARLNIHFDEYSGESKVSEAEMQSAASKLRELGVAEENNGALLVDFTKAVPGKEGKQLGKAILRKKDGTALYLTRDISELLDRHKRHHFDKMIYVIASEQDLHVKQFFKIVRMMGHEDIADKCQHINFGLVLGMSTRKGTVKFLDDILRDVGDHMHETMKKNEDKYTQVEDPAKIADILGISSVMVQDMSGKRINNYTFDLSRMTSFEGDTGPYLQYAHARICSITRRAGLTEGEIASADLSLLTEPMAIDLVRVISQWPDVVQNVLKTLEPTTVLTYLFKMTHTLSTSYGHLRIVGSDPEVMVARMALYDAARVVLRNGMKLLGLSPVERPPSLATIRPHLISISNHTPKRKSADSRPEFTKLPIVAKRLESRKSLLGADPGFAQQGAPYPHDDYAPADDTFSDAHAQNYPNETYVQASYVQPTYAENAYMGSAYDQGYAHREGLPVAESRDASTHHDKVGFLRAKWPASFMAITCLQALICLGFEAYVFGKFQTSLGDHIDKANNVQSQYKTIPTFLTLFIFGFLYELLLVWDALGKKNTIQIIGVCIANLALMIYTCLQVDQIRRALQILEASAALKRGVTSAELWGDLKAYLIAIPAIIAFTTVGMSFVAWKLYQVFAWDILKNIGADYRMKKRLFHYQIYIALLKFDFFFFLGFIIQFVVIVAQKTDPEFALTIATIPVTIAILLAAAYFTRRENKAGMTVVLVLYFGGLTYFIFKLIRIYQPGYKQYYVAVRKSLTAFAVITILLILLTIANGIICMRNFGAGLKQHLGHKRKSEHTQDANSFNMQDVKPKIGSRMTID